MNVRTELVVHKNNSKGRTETIVRENTTVMTPNNEEIDYDEATVMIQDPAVTVRYVQVICLYRIKYTNNIFMR